MAIPRARKIKSLVRQEGVTKPYERQRGRLQLLQINVLIGYPSVQDTLFFSRMSYAGSSTNNVFLDHVINELLAKLV